MYVWLSESALRELVTNVRCCQHIQMIAWAAAQLQRPWNARSHRVGMGFLGPVGRCRGCPEWLCRPLSREAELHRATRCTSLTAALLLLSKSGAFPVHGEHACEPCLRDYCPRKCPRYFRRSSVFTNQPHISRTRGRVRRRRRCDGASPVCGPAHPPLPRHWPPPRATPRSPSEGSGVPAPARRRAALPQPLLRHSLFPRPTPRGVARPPPRSASASEGECGPRRVTAEGAAPTRTRLCRLAARSAVLGSSGAAAGGLLSGTAAPPVATRPPPEAACAWLLMHAAGAITSSRPPPPRPHPTLTTPAAVWREKRGVVGAGGGAGRRSGPPPRTPPRLHPITCRIQKASRPTPLSPPSFRPVSSARRPPEGTADPRCRPRQKPADLQAGRAPLISSGR